ncbi:acyl-CoA dehydrogenase [Halorussus sp. MSC15.2]|uniref:acyl-CoA dehydrogenase n=1 Tax=Halorussus sp. MSC15.2 TaxID=2283638 RepID=UPI0013D53FB4|nr:acyl-CoA dehydrogenase [Halorussus sp. MSC15.2]NEU58745.1 acyl-CoA dehydrogenase [Halorussus sp. MSC15.2]
MSNFKSGSGNLDFGGDDDGDGDEDDAAETAEAHVEESEAESTSTEESTPASASESPSASPSRTSSESENRSEQSTTGRGSARESSESTASPDEYPYFVRRSNVGDERDTRLEIHVRDKVADQEAEFRSELADLLGTSEVSKTDAREFALLAAFQNPELIAELMEDEGFGTLQ